jgi:UDP-glucose 4-epimerase
MRGKRVLVTGATGFIGRHLVKRLVESGAEVTAMARTGEDVSALGDVRVARADLRDRETLVRLAEGKPEVVLHLAGYSLVGESFRQIEPAFDLNARGTALLLDALPDVGAFVYASTCQLYDTDGGVPHRETSPLAPVSPYAISKLAGELSCRAAARGRRGRTRVVVLRLFNVFGPGQLPPAVVPQLLQNFLSGEPVLTTSGEQTRDFVYVDDVVEAFVAAGAHGSPIDTPINLCSGREVAIRDLARQIAKLTGGEDRLHVGALPPRPNDVARSFGDGTSAAELLGWRPRIPLEEGLARTVAHAQAERVGPRRV